MKTNNTRIHIRAFTLIELLVVISIIAVLMSIMMPALNKVRNQARKVVCYNNLHQIHVACSTYAADCNGKFPSRGKDYDGYAHRLYRAGKDMIDMKESFVKPYLGEEGNKVLYCPGALRYFRSADSTTDVNLMTYQYFNFEKKSLYWNPAVKQPNLSSLATAKPDSVLWSCLVFVEGASMDSGKYTCHDGPEKDKRNFKGGAYANVGGDCGWMDDQVHEVFSRIDNINFLWPKQ